MPKPDPKRKKPVRVIGKMTVENEVRPVKPQPPRWWTWETALGWKLVGKGKAMEFLARLAPGKKTNLLVVVGIALALACPFLLARGFDCAWLDELLKGIGAGAITTLRLAIPAPSNGKSFLASLAAMISVALDSFGVFGMLGLDAHMAAQVADTLFMTFMGAGVYGLRDAMGRT